MGVNLSRLNARVTEHLLHQPQVSTTGEQMGGKTMTKAVGADFRLYPNSQGIPFNKTPELNSIEW